MRNKFKIVVITSLVIALTACKSSKETTKVGSSKSKPHDVSQLFNQMDSNKDGKISKAEAKGNLKENFRKRDKNKDGFITMNEMTRKKR